MPEKSKVRRAIEGLIGGTVMWLLGEENDVQPRDRPLYTKEEREELYSVKRDVARYPRRHREW